MQEEQTIRALQNVATEPNRFRPLPTELGSAVFFCPYKLSPNGNASINVTQDSQNHRVLIACTDPASFSTAFEDAYQPLETQFLQYCDLLDADETLCGILCNPGVQNIFLPRTAVLQLRGQLQKNQNNRTPEAFWQPSATSNPVQPKTAESDFPVFETRWGASSEVDTGGQPFGAGATSVAEAVAEPAVYATDNTAAESKPASSFSAIEAEATEILVFPDLPDPVLQAAGKYLGTCESVRAAYLLPETGDKDHPVIAIDWENDQVQPAVLFGLVQSTRSHLGPGQFLRSTSIYSVSSKNWLQNPIYQKPSNAPEQEETPAPAAIPPVEDEQTVTQAAPVTQTADTAENREATSPSIENVTLPETHEAANVFVAPAQAFTAATANEDSNTAEPPHAADPEQTISQSADIAFTLDAPPSLEPHLAALGESLSDAFGLVPQVNRACFCVLRQTAPGGIDTLFVGIDSDAATLERLTPEIQLQCAPSLGGANLHIITYSHLPTDLPTYNIYTPAASLDQNQAALLQALRQYGEHASSGAPALFAQLLSARLLLPYHIDADGDKRLEIASFAGTDFYVAYTDAQTFNRNKKENDQLFVLTLEQIYDALLADNAEVFGLALHPYLTMIDRDLIWFLVTRARATDADPLLTTAPDACPSHLAQTLQSQLAYLPKVKAAYLVWITAKLYQGFAVVLDAPDQNTCSYTSSLDAVYPPQALPNSPIITLPSTLFDADTIAQLPVLYRASGMHHM